MSEVRAVDPKTGQPLPSVGRIVHYLPGYIPDEVASKPAPQAAIVTRVDREFRTVQLYVFPDDHWVKPHVQPSVRHVSEVPAGVRAWDWPPRV